MLGCAVGQIAKSLVFTRASGAPVLVIASGAHRVDEAKVAALAGEADRQGRRRRSCASVTGYAIGGIPPLAHAQALAHVRRPESPAIRDCLRAGGTPHAMFPIAPAELVRVAGGTVADTAP